MGEIADEMLQRYLDGDFEDDEDDFGAVCKFCGMHDLAWEEGRDKHNRKKWMLVDGAGAIHVCRISTDELED